MSPQATLLIAGITGALLFLGLSVFWTMMRLKLLSLERWKLRARIIRLGGAALAVAGSLLLLLADESQRASGLLAGCSGIAVAGVAWMQLAIMRVLTKK